MVNRWIKTNSLLASCTAFWLAALSPIPAIGRGISYTLAIVSGIQLVQESRRLVQQSARTIALDTMNQELEQLEIALHTQAQEIALTEAYASEVKEELTQTLEALYREQNVVHPDGLQTSTSDKKAFYLAVKSLLEVKGKAYVLEEVLHLSGGQWAKGEQRLQEILDEGDRNEWR